MDYRDIQELKAFFSAIKISGYKQTLKEIPNFGTVDGQRTPYRKDHCLELLRKLPKFQGDKFKDDDAIVKYLSDPNERKFLYDDFKEGRIELTQALEKEPVVVDVVSEQPSGQEEQLVTQTGEPPATMAGGTPFIPSIPSISSPPRIIRNIPQTKPPAETPLEKRVPGLKTTPETGLDYEGKPILKEASGPIRSAGKTLASKGQIGIKRGLSRGFGGILSGVGSGGVRFLSGAGGALSNIGTQMTRRPIVKGPSRKVGLMLLGGFIMLTFLTGFTGAPLPGGPVPSLSPGQITSPSPQPAPKPPPAGVVVSCPLDGTRTIRCGSFMSDERFNKVRCAGPRPIDRGHCGLRYRCYNKNGIQITNPAEISNLRRAHSIDVDAAPGEQVKLPFIRGQSVEWTYYGEYKRALTPEEGGGHGHIFSTSVGGDKWTIHFVHVDKKIIQKPTDRSTYLSGDPVVTIAATGFPHLHVNIGRNPTGANGGSGWLDPESLGMCVN